MKKILFILLLTIPSLGFGQCDFFSWNKIPIEEIIQLEWNNQTHIDSLSIINNLFYDDTFLFSGVVVDYYTDGNKKLIWEIKSGKKNGLVVGFNENYTDECFKYFYIYQYDSYGHKVGNQFEFYTSSEQIPFFNYNFNPNNSLEWTISDCDETFFGNRDGGFDIFWRKYVSYEGTDEGECVMNQDYEYGKKHEELCPSGRLTVFYQGLPDLINTRIDLKKSNIPKLTKNQTKLFTTCYGTMGCFWRLHSFRNSWWFE